MMLRVRRSQPLDRSACSASAARIALFIAYNYPPSTEVGTHRTLRFARYLPEFGWQAAVLAPRPSDLIEGAKDTEPDAPGVYRARVRRPLKAGVRLRNRLRARRRRADASDAPPPPLPPTAASSGWLHRWVEPWFATPDEQVGWLVPATFRGLHAIGESGARVLYTTGPPHSAHLIGASLKAVTGLPWVADFRDPWARKAWAAEADRRGLRARAQRGLEALVVRLADRVVFNTEPMTREFRSVYPALSARFLAIPNGYDPAEIEDFPGVEPSPEAFTLSHAGTLYRRRSPMPLLEAIGRLRDRGIISAGRFELRLIGKIDPAFGAEAYVSRHALSAFVRLLPPVSRTESLRAMAESHVLLLIQPDTQLQVPGKLFEYLLFRKPVLALASPIGATADLVRDFGLGRVAPDRDVEAICGVLGQYVTEFEAGRLPPVDVGPALEAFDGRALTARLAEVFTALAG